MPAKSTYVSVTPKQRSKEKSKQKTQTGCMGIWVGFQFICHPYVLAEVVKEDKGVFKFVFKSIDPATEEVVVCRTISTADDPCCQINGREVKAPEVFRPFCWKDTRVSVYTYKG